MDHFYDGQIRRYVTQFMRVFIGFQWKAGDDSLSTVPVMYGDLSRQVANIIKENSENKLLTVPRIACYISGLEMDTTRLSDPTFVSKVHIRERRYTDAGGTRDYQSTQGGNYTVERLMPTPYKLTMKADLWTSNTDQKLQLLEQILVLFTPSLELQTTDNYIDWTSLSAMYLKSTNFTSRTIPAGAESDIDICTLEFEMPIWISPPAKVKKLGIVQTIIANVFTEEGNLIGLEDLIFNQFPPNASITTNNYGVLLFKSSTNNPSDNIYDLTLVDPSAVINDLGLEKEYTNETLDWNKLFEVFGGYRPGSEIWFKKSDGSEIQGTFVVNALDSKILTVSLDADTYPGNDVIAAVDELGRRLSGASAGTIDAIIDPYKFNPIASFGSRDNIPVGIRYLMLDRVNNSQYAGQSYPDSDREFDSSATLYDGPDGWSNSELIGDDPVIKAYAIVEWNGVEWITVWDPDQGDVDTIIQNLRTGIKYRWDGEQWLKAFEGEYAPGEWNFKLIP